VIARDFDCGIIPANRMRLRRRLGGSPRSDCRRPRPR
jgi:hypothetical protein